MKKKLYRWFIKWFVIKLNLYLLWSRVHQKLFQKKRIPIPSCNNLVALETLLEGFTWYADGWKELWDVVNHPEHTYYKYLNDIHSGFDCDDFAALAAMVCNRDLFPSQDAKILSVQWLNKANKFKGHNVCVFIYEGDPVTIDLRLTSPYPSIFPSGQGDRVLALGWIGNYFEGRAKLGYSHITDIISEIVGDGMLLSWFVFDWECKKIERFVIEKD